MRSGVEGFETVVLAIGEVVHAGEVPVGVSPAAALALLLQRDQEAVLGVPRGGVVAGGPGQFRGEAHKQVVEPPTANDGIVQLAEGQDQNHRVAKALEHRGHPAVNLSKKRLISLCNHRIIMLRSIKDLGAKTLT